ncbi:MAG: UvrD-helicase domain-containing protein [Candidatus Onthovivens sp.]|nr:UvrD-helicase domain-containing protein [Candidatus Onthovivens sp.]
MKRTEAQQSAIDSKGNVIVFAGAGSGKTSVLTERVFVNIKNGIKLDELLILTFTDNAACEMKERIKDVLAKDVKTESLVPLVDSANICTYDSYFLFLVKKYAAKLGLSTNISNMPADIEKVKKRQILKDILAKKYNEKNPIFTKFVTFFSDKNDNKLVSFITKVDEIVCKNSNKYDFISSYKDKFLSVESLEHYAEGYVYKAIHNIVEEALYKASFFEENSLIDAYKTLFSPFSNCSCFKDFLDYPASELTNVPRKIKITEEDKVRKQEIDSIYNDLKKIKKALSSTENLMFDLNNNISFIPMILDIVYQIEIEIDKFKREKECFTFSDIAQYALSLLEHNDEIRNNIKNKLKLIMIDEYQDTSIQQEKFINLISNDNVFVVGDVKQSIYGFRDANPQQFIDKYNNYKNSIGGKAIDMNTNFRSRKEVLKAVNYIFSNIMDEKHGGANYKSQLIETGNKLYDEKFIDNQGYGITRLNFFAPEKNANLTSACETNAIINDIKRRIINKEKVFDKESGTLRDIEFRDFTILVSRKTRFEDIEESFSKASIPINAIYDENIVSDDSITVLINILKFIDEYNKNLPNESILKHAFFSIARSFLFEYNDEKLYKLSLNESYKNDEKYLTLADFSKKNKDILISDLYLNIFNEFKFIDRFSTLNDATSRISFNKIFYDRTKIMDDLGFALTDFITYLEILDELDIKMESRKGIVSKNAVTLTTIHKSKGLEYPIVYLPLRYSLPNNNSEISPFFVDAKTGFWLPSLHNANNKSLHSIIDDYLEPKVDIGELIRVLYVAVTRAKEEVVITKKHVLSSEDVKDKSFDDLNLIIKSNNLKNDINDNISSMKTLGELLDAGLLDYKDIKDLPLITNDLSFEQEIKTIETESFKIIEFNPEFKEIIRKRASKEVDDDVDLSVLKVGTHFHLLMEMANLKTKDVSFITNKRDRLIIENVLNNKIFANILDAQNIYKEYEYYDDVEKYTGVIDLIVEYRNFVDIIDYKLKNVEDSEYENQLRKYMSYVSRVFKKEVNCYLLSILTNEVRKING